MDWTDKTAQTWTYRSANEVEITGDVTSQYPVGTMVRYKQGGNYKYGYVESRALDSGDTVLKINAGSDFSVANASITDNYAGYGATAEGFPGRFSFNTSWTATSGTAPSIGNGTLGQSFMMRGAWVEAVYGLLVGTNTNVGNGGQWRFALPTGSNAGWPADNGQVYLSDTGVTAYSGNALLDSASTFRPSAVLSNGTYTQNAGVTQTVPFSWGNGDFAQMVVRYPLETAVTQL